MNAESSILTPARRDWLRRRFGWNARFGEPMARHTSLGVGGPAEARVHPSDEASLGELLRWADGEGVPRAVVGDGTNLLVSDAGIPGVTIALPPGFRRFSVDGTGAEVRVTAGAGLRTRTLCRRVIDLGLDGLMAGVGIPGTVGGGVAVNAGNGRGALGDALETLFVMGGDGRIRALDRSELILEYRRTRRPGAETSVIVSAVFRVRSHPGGRAALAAEAEAMRAERWRSQPRGARSAGCFFRNPETGPTAGALIDRAGLKGASEGGARISNRHANFIVTRSGATAADVIALAERVRETVFRRFGVRLRPEVRTLGA
jgi:UDP-N-acetylmuramate dehydrogenase